VFKNFFKGIFKFDNYGADLFQKNWITFETYSGYPLVSFLAIEG